MTPLLDQLHPTPAPLLDFSPPASAPSLDVPPQLLTQLATRETPVTERPATTRAITSDTPAVVTPQLAQPDPSVTTAVAPRITVAPDAPAAQHPSTAPIVDSATPVVATPPGGTFQHSGFDSNSRQPHSIPLMESDSAITPAQAAPDGTFAAAAAVATPGAAPLPPDIRPSEVVNQIAHQADLYRVPGDRSVHIQLHPEGLGGVDVTLRYSAANGIQLHLNVEHASTGALVQAGWTELRDALATQGIHSDRLVMSISAPANASGPNLSNGNGSNRSDGGLASFTQGQNSQQRQETQEQRTARGWNAAIDPILPSSFDVSQRVAPASAGHIDYRV
jgi:flagellar hook-length control protein FliK